MTKTPKTDAEARLTTLDCDDSCVEIYIKRDGKNIEGDIVLADFARQLEEENVAMKNAITTAAELIDGLDLHLIGNHGMFILTALEKLQPFLK